ncbi:MAG TPA: 23S rRNA pseudouridine(1911/1915/1917) synthase RluD [Steroidobacteraceae bacterium]|nr:23S rRNA pseudouridine(1911/1915/1917) synthase RluD [Steroidobacteraceae bacterium]
MPPEFQTHVLDLPSSAAGLRLDQALAAALPQYSRARLQRWIRDGAVHANGRPVRARDRVRGGEQLVVKAQFAAEGSVAAQPLPLDILHEDAALLVLNKPAGMVVHPGAGNREHTLQNALLAYDAALARVPRAGLVHRLDKDTSGVLLIARTPEAHTRLVQALSARQVGREYLALCAGAPTGGGRIDEPIGRHRSARTRMAVRSDGREAITHYRIEERLRAHTLLRVQLETGRTHQIRVHLAYIGFPIVGDPLYGGRARSIAGDAPEVNAALQGFRRQALHAQRLRLAHPVSGRAQSFEAPLPADLDRLLRLLREDARAAPKSAAPGPPRT